MKFTFYESVQDPGGNVLDNAKVFIYLTGTTTPAKIYDNNGAVKTTVPQLLTDSKGYFWFQVDNADYDAEQLFDIKITKDGYDDLLISKVEIIGSSNITAGKVVIADANGLPSEGTNTDSEVSDAVDKRHTQNTDQYLDYGGANQVAVADAKDAVDKRHNQQHSIISTADHTSTATPGRLLKADDNGLPIDATNTDAEVSGAVTKANSALQNVVDDTSPQAGGEFNFAAHSAGFTEQSITSSSGAATIDWTKGNKAAITLTEDVTFTFTNPSNVCNLLLRITNDATGGYNLTFPSSVVWLGTEPTWTDGGANKTIIMSAYFDGTTYWAQATPWQQ